MDLDIADTAPSASTSTAVAIQQQEGTHGNEPAIEIPKASSSQKAGPLLFPFESEGLPSSRITGTNDLLTTFGLAGTYDRSVRQYLNLPAIHNDVKGKGRAIEFGDNAPSPAAAAVKAEEEAAGTREKGKTMKKHYSHMIADVPGQNKLARDHVLRDLLLNPEPPDHVRISLLDDTALREAFTLEVGMLPDFDATIWRADADEQARKKRKKRKQEENGGIQLTNGGAPSPAATGAGPGGLTFTFNAKKRKVD